ncbi:hypothetical protein V8G54_023285 [Vigna mungo]|uniref:Uncharacterized protein n=1 Tax=Vigna mungo TaxID=3915 RepID=A0AAQ3RS26_VIGMU
MQIVRESNGNSTALEESIEIPPPRPKRKPIHPYPRKLNEIPKKEISDSEHPLRSNSLKSSDFGQENNSPKLDTPIGSLSPVSSISGEEEDGMEKRLKFKLSKAPSVALRK